MDEGALARQFAKTPYAVAFRSAGTTFILVTLHVVFGEKAADRLGELRAIARWMREWADDTADEFHQNLLVLGRLQHRPRDDPNYQAFVAEGCAPPAELEGRPRTLPARSTGPKFYDQIAWFGDGGGAKLTPYLRRPGRARRVEQARAPRYDPQSESRFSYHYPLWCGFGLPRR